MDYRFVMKVLVTGGAGYIGAVTATALERAGHTPVVLDSLVSGPEAYVGDRIFYRGDIADRALLSLQNGPDVAGCPHRGERVSGGGSRQTGADVPEPGEQHRRLEGEVRVGQRYRQGGELRARLLRRGQGPNPSPMDSLMLFSRTASDCLSRDSSIS